MGYERQCFINAHPYQRSEQRVDQANGFYRRGLTTRLGVLELRVPRTRSGHFQTQVLGRYQRREPVINQALQAVFLLGVSTRQTGHALATLIEDAVSAATVSSVAKALDSAVNSFHRRRLSDAYRYLILDGVSVRIRLVGKVQRRMVLCAYGITRQGQRELIDFQIVKAEGEDSWYGFLWNLWSRGDEVDSFALGQEEAMGFFRLLECLRTTPGEWAKGQVMGPFSFGLTVTDQNSRATLYNETLADTIVKNIAMKARWQVRQLKHAARRSHVIIFVDEPYMASFGSAFISLSREQAVSMLNEVFAAIHAEGALAGLHCCGHTDWSVLMETAADILNLDAYSYLENLALYPGELSTWSSSSSSGR